MTVNGNDNNKPQGRRAGILGFIAAGIVCVSLAAAGLYAGYLLTEAWRSAEQLAALLPGEGLRVASPPDAGPVESKSPKDGDPAEATDDNLSPATAAVLRDMKRFGVVGDLGDEALAALAGIEPSETDDQLLIIEPGIPSTLTGTGYAEPTPQQSRIQAARSGSEAAMLDIIADLDSDDPDVNSEAWAALNRMARTGNAAAFEALLAAADTDPAVRERAGALLRSLPYD